MSQFASEANCDTVAWDIGHPLSIHYAKIIDGIMSIPQTISTNEPSSSTFTRPKETSTRKGSEAKQGLLDELVANFNPNELTSVTNLTEQQKNAFHLEDASQEPNLRKVDATKLKFFEKFLNDGWGLRKFFALGNEIAESTHPLLQTVLPKPVADLLYKIFWSLALIATGSRIGANATQSAPHINKLKAGAKMLAHDGVSAIVAPTIVANISNWIQEKIYSVMRLPKIIGNTLKAGVSLTACYFVIHALDPHAAELSSKLTNLKDDRYNEIKAALGAGH